MPRYAVVLIGGNGVLGGRESLRVVEADTPELAVRSAHPRPPFYEVKHAWVHQLEGKASLVEVNVKDPEWGPIREAVAS